MNENTGNIQESNEQVTSQVEIAQEVESQPLTKAEEKHILKVYGEEVPVTLEEMKEKAQKLEAIYRKHGNKVGQFEKIIPEYESNKKLLEDIAGTFQDKDKLIEVLINMYGEEVVLDHFQDKVYQRALKQEELKRMDPTQRELLEHKQKLSELEGKLTEKERKEKEYFDSLTKKQQEQVLVQKSQEVQSYLLQAVAEDMNARGFKIDSNASQEEITESVKELNNYYSKLETVFQHLEEDAPELDINNPDHVMIVLKNPECVKLMKELVAEEETKWFEKSKGKLGVADVVSLISKHGVDTVMKSLPLETVQQMKKYFEKSIGEEKNEVKKNLKMNDIFGDIAI
jgi:hypothetical protein